MATIYDKDFSDLGYAFISESSGIQEINNMDVCNTNGFTVVEFDAVLQSFDVKNRNERYYDAQNVWSNIVGSEKIQSQLAHNGWFSELNHPYQEYEGMKLTPERIQNIDYDRRCSVISNPQLKGNLLYGHIRTTPGTEFGRGLAADMIAVGYKPMYSVRAIAGMTMRNNKPYVMVRRLITYDTVNYASHRESDMASPGKVTTKCVKNGSYLESAGCDYECNMITESGVIIPLKEILARVGMDANTSVVMESFGLETAQLVGFNAERTHSIIKDGDNRIYAKMNPNTVAEVNDFLASF